eukprot:7380890-Prymnesium_polylepis.2
MPKPMTTNLLRLVNTCTRTQQTPTGAHFVHPCTHSPAHRARAACHERGCRDVALRVDARPADRDGVDAARDEQGHPRPVEAAKAIPLVVLAKPKEERHHQEQAARAWQVGGSDGTEWGATCATRRPPHGAAEAMFTAVARRQRGAHLAALLISIMPVFDTSIGLIAISLRCTSRSSTAAIMLSNLLRTHTRTVRAALTEAQPIVPGGEVHAFRAVHPDRGLLWAVADGHGRTLGRFRDADRRGGRICRACSAAHVAQPGRGEGYVGAHVQNDARDYVEQRNHSEAAHLCHLAEEALDHHRDERRNVSHDDDRAHRG